MDWMQQSVEMMKSWTEIQKKLWDSWMSTVGTIGDQQANPMNQWLTSWRETAQKSLDAWEELANKMVDTQSQWAGTDAAAKLWPGREEDVKRMAQSWTEQTLTMMKAWTEAQRRLWDDWFAAAAAGGGEGLGREWFERWQETARSSMAAWEELSRKTVDTQGAWFGDWMKTADAGTTGSKPSSESASPGTGKKTA